MTIPINYPARYGWLRSTCRQAIEQLEKIEVNDLNDNDRYWIKSVMITLKISDAKMEYVDKVVPL